MPRFGKTSKKRLATCDSKLQALFNEVIKYVDCSVLCGHRGKDDQDKAFDEGRSKVKYPNGRHNASPSLAVDVTPYPVDWKDRERQTLFAGFVLGIAQKMGLKIRWGGDWNMNFEVKDNNFDDFPHFEIVKPKEEKRSDEWRISQYNRNRPQEEQVRNIKELEEKIKNL